MEGAAREGCCCSAPCGLAERFYGKLRGSKDSWMRLFGVMACALPANHLHNPAAPLQLPRSFVLCTQVISSLSRP